MVYFEYMRQGISSCSVKFSWFTNGWLCLSRA